MSISRALLTGVIVVVLAIPTIASAGGRPHVSVQSGAVNTWRVLLKSPSLKEPGSLAIDLRGNAPAQKWAYVADAATGRIVKFGTGGKVLGGWKYQTAPGRASSPVYLAVGGSGNVFVSSPVDRSITKYSPAGRLLGRWRGLQQPRGIVVDSRGNIYVAEYGAHAVIEIPASGAPNKMVDMYTIWGAGSLGRPTNVALNQPEGYVYASTRCTAGVDCGSGVPSDLHYDEKDALVEFRFAPSSIGNPREFWFGLGHNASGTAQEAPGKEAEPFVTIDAMVNDSHGNVYVAGNMYPLGRRQGYGVVKYSSLGYKSAFWYLPAQQPVGGIALDGKSNIYVSQGSKILRLIPGKTPPLPYPG